MANRAIETIQRLLTTVGCDIVNPTPFTENGQTGVRAWIETPSGDGCYLTLHEDATVVAAEHLARGGRRTPE